MAAAHIERKPLDLKRTISILVLLSLLLVAVCIVGLSVGSVDIPFAAILPSLFGDASVDQSLRTIVVDIRLPRLFLAMLVGASLSISGAVFQALLRNPLAEPYILGISSGGTVGAILAIGLGLGFSAVTTPLASFLGSALVMLLVYTIAHRRGQLDTNTLLLAGVMIGAFFNAAVLLIIALFNQELRNSFLWLMGNLSNANMESLTIVAPLVLVASAFLLMQSRKYNLIATGDETAMQLGVDVRHIKRLSYILASLITGVVVSVSGVIGFVGLIIPHMCRMMFGPDHRLLMPASILLGGSFMIVADLISRTLLAPTEIPVGAVTAAIGAPLFVYLLKRT
ncbi:MAG: iron ABC transporter permease [Bacteroidetes bacterium]|nr:iron ABC transporter permease [Bacteroidota bacterium]MCW5895636.1 iron ABC transporter permease [Bacteroidota bacterium]